MTISATDQFAGVCRITMESFDMLLKQAQSPALQERNGGEYWDAIRHIGIDPLFVLAIFQHESQMGLKGYAATTHSWGNTRPPSFGVEQVGVATQPSGGELSKYATWLDGCVSTACRLAAPDYAYYGKNIGEAIRLWAPPSENDTGGYLLAVLAFMEAHKNTEERLGDICDRQYLLPASAPNWNHRLLTGGRPSWVTIHETDNRAIGADADMHAHYVVDQQPEVSFHAVVDDKESIQLMPWNWSAWHAGDEEGNSTSVGLEICVNADGNFPLAVVKAAKVTTLLLREFGLGKDRVRKHGTWPGTDHKLCPRYLNNGQLGPTWDSFLKMVADPTLIGAQGMNEADTLKAYGETIPHEFRGYLLREGEADLRAFGGTQNERVCLYERLVTHRLAGKSYVLTLELFDKLRADHKINMYPNWPW